MKINDLNHLPNEERYKYLITTVIETKEIWLLQAKDGLYAMFDDTSNQQYIPVWPGKENAEKHITDEWSDYKPVAMKLFEFANWMTELKTDNVLIGAFPDANMQAIPIDPLEMKEHLQF